MKIVIVGGGPGGYVAALSAIQAGAKVILVEKEHLGGTCVNRGCIPTKALLKAIHPLVEAKRYQSMGIDFSGVKTDLAKIRAHAQKAATLSRSGVEYLLKKREVQLIRGEVVGSKEGAVKIRLSDGEEFFESFDKLIIATGSQPSIIPGMPMDGEKVVSSDEALLLKKIPESLLVVGGGVIGIEMATIYQALGSKVSIVEMTSQLIPGEDIDCVNVLTQTLMKMGIQIWTSQKIEGIETREDGCSVCLNRDNTLSKEDFEQILIATGRKPLLPVSVLESLGVTFSPKGIPVNPFMQTNHPDVYAIGDVNGVSLLAHTAFKEAKIACKHILGQETEGMNYTTIPRVVYSIPEYASTGDLSKGEVFSFPYAANGRARACNIREGLIKLFVVDGLIKGCAILGENASDMISMASIAIDEKLPLHRLGEIVFPHPTFSEVFADVIEVALGSPIHLA